MGCGDEIMALGQAEAIHRVTGGRVLIVGRDGAPRYHPIWDGHHAIAGPGEDFTARLINGRGARPYIKAWAEADGLPMAVYSEWRAQDSLGRLALTMDELALGAELLEKLGPYVVVEPNLGPGTSPNKDWGLVRYQDVLARCPEITFVQMSGPGPRLESAQQVATESFRAACGVLSHAAAYLGPEGGLHHAAAALRRPAAVIFGSFISPESTGYPFHANFYAPDAHAPCGRWAPCHGCERAMERIKPESVAAVLRGLLRPDGIPVVRHLREVR